MRKLQNNAKNQVLTTVLVRFNDSVKNIHEINKDIRKQIKSNPSDCLGYIGALKYKLFGNNVYDSYYRGRTTNIINNLSHQVYLARSTIISISILGYVSKENLTTFELLTEKIISFKKRPLSPLTIKLINSLLLDLVFISSELIIFCDEFSRKTTDSIYNKV